MIPDKKEIKVGDLMCNIENIIAKDGPKALSLPLTRRSLDYILECLENKGLVLISLSKTLPPRKFVTLTLEGKKFLRNTIPKVGIFSDENTEEKEIEDELK
jgi:DNA-binding PadR family transcriptional regulator